MRAWKWLLLGFPLLLVLLVGGCIGIAIANRVLYSPRSFDGEHWRAGDVRQRARMVTDLVGSGTLPGKSRAEVSALLGPPDRENSGVWEYDYVYGDLLGDALDLPFSGWLYSMRIAFDDATGLVCHLDTRD